MDTVDLIEGVMDDGVLSLDEIIREVSRATILSKKEVERIVRDYITNEGITLDEG